MAYDQIMLYYFVTLSWEVENSLTIYQLARINDSEEDKKRKEFFFAKMII